jgi:hypothetical protein
VVVEEDKLEERRVGSLSNKSIREPSLRKYGMESSLYHLYASASRYRMEEMVALNSTNSADSKVQSAQEQSQHWKRERIEEEEEESGGGVWGCEHGEAVRGG